MSVNKWRTLRPTATVFMVGPSGSVIKIFDDMELARKEMEWAADHNYQVSWIKTSSMGKEE